MSGVSEEPDEEKKQLSRLTNLLWQVTPGHELPPWHSQRYMLERLHEEMLRAQRYNQPLSIVLGEIQLRESAQGETYAVQSPPQICYWTAERVNQQRRRSDVVGQYGSQGFLVLLPSTGANGALDCCHRLQQTLESEPLTASELSTVSVRSLFGMASTTESLSESRQLLRRAEERLLASHGGTSVE